ncbi:MAG: S24 family peptidase [Planctomycetota bacterium]
MYAAKRYVQLCKSVLKNVAAVSEKVEVLLTAPKAEDMEDSLSVVLERGRATNQHIALLRAACKTTEDLLYSLRKETELGDKISKYRFLADSGEATKRLAGIVREEVIEVVKDVEDQMKDHFSRLYENEILTLDLLTTGHAANPNVRGEINVYLRAGNQRVPVGPFCNAGRMRALILSFIFALLKKSTGSLGVMVLDDPVLSLDHEHKARFVDHLVRPLLGETQIVMATHYKDFYKVAESAFADSERLLMPPRRSGADGVSFEPGDLLERVENALKEPTCSWREVGNNLRLWAERTLATLSGYCPSPFVIFNNIPGSLRAYRAIGDPNVATAERDRIVDALEGPQFQRIANRLAHDEDPAESEVQDGLKVLKECEKTVRAEIERFRGLYEHALLARAVDARPSVRTLSLQDQIEDLRLNIVARAAAAEDGVGVYWEENELSRLAGNQVAMLKFDTISPIGLIGQYLLLDSEDREPEDSDLVVVETQDKRRYVRRYWLDGDKTIWLEAANPTSSYKPVRLCSGIHLMRRVVGVLFCAVGVKGGQEGDEWVPGKLPDRWLDDVVGVRVEGSSMEPVARKGQIVLLRKKSGQEILKGDLACIDMADRESVIKRCYPSDSCWVLCSVNPNDIQDPISVGLREIRHAYPLVGVVFEVGPMMTVPD